MATLKTLSVAEDGGNYVSEAYQVDDNNVVIEVTTTEASTITILRSINGETFKAIPDLSFSVDTTTDEFNLTDFVQGQHIKVSSTGVMTSCKAMS